MEQRLPAETRRTVNRALRLHDTKGNATEAYRALIGEGVFAETFANLFPSIVEYLAHLGYGLNDPSRAMIAANAAFYLARVEDLQALTRAIGMNEISWRPAYENLLVMATDTKGPCLLDADCCRTVFAALEQFGREGGVNPVPDLESADACRVFQAHIRRQLNKQDIEDTIYDILKKLGKTPAWLANRAEEHGVSLI